MVVILNDRRWAEVRPTQGSVGEPANPLLLVDCYLQTPPYTDLFNPHTVYE